MKTQLLTLCACILTTSVAHAAPSKLSKATPIIRAQAATVGVTGSFVINLGKKLPGTKNVYRYTAARSIDGAGSGAAGGKVDLYHKTATFETIFPFAQ